MQPQEILDHIYGHHVTVFRDGAGHIVGFGSTQVHGSEFYLSGIAVAKEYQGSGIAGEIMRAELGDMVRGHYETLTMRTQNELVERATVAQLQALVRSGEIAGFELERQPLPGLYGRQLAEDMPPPTPGGPYAGLNREAGDAYRLIFKIRY
jgi:ribosomal protein S18 acetylase RimI-like enzyme